LGILLSLLLMGAGAAMTWTNTAPSGGIDPNAGGLVLLGVGLIWLVISAAIWDIGSEDPADDEFAGQRIIYTAGARRPPRPTHHR
jgi:hypothetical protein